MRSLPEVPLALGGAGVIPVLTHDRCALLRGDMREVLAQLPEESVDAVVTDPPYELGFMGKSWDSLGVAFDPETWRAVLRVLKPGGHLIAFGGSRTYHRIACAIEDAGFEIRDSIAQWIYGCVPIETEILTERGWVLPSNLLDGEQVVNVDEHGRAFLGALQNVSVYPFDGEMVQVANRSTLQMLTPGHTVHAYPVRVGARPNRDSIESPLEACTAEQFADRDREGIFAHRLPLAARYTVARRTLESVDLAALYGWVISEGHYHTDVHAVSIYQNEGDKADEIAGLLDRLQIPHSVYQRERTDYDGTVRPSVQFYLKVGPWCDRIRSDMPGAKPTPPEWLAWLPDAEAQALFETLVDGDGTRSGPDSGAWYQKRSDVRAWFQSLCFRLGYRTSENVDKISVAWCRRDSTEVQRGKHRERSTSRVTYTGEVWCPTVESGRWVARYRGHVFVTGNSGFPKSLDVSKAIDKGAGHWRGRAGAVTIESQPSKGTEYERTDKGEPITAAAAAWRGWGTALKPSHEPTVLARKPLGGTVVACVLEHGTGALNIDACRVGDEARVNPPASATATRFSIGDGWRTDAEPRGCNGRWPANAVFQHAPGCCPVGEREVVRSVGRNAERAGIPPTTIGPVGLSARRVQTTTTTATEWDCAEGCPVLALERVHEDAPAFFYCAKPSGRERDHGLEDFTTKTGGELTGREDGSAGLNSPRAGAGRTGGRKNIHPTVKPVELLRYLCRLVTPPGGVVLDTFCGSGSTGVAALAEGFDFVGVERDLDDETGLPLGYCDIARARLERALADTATKEED